MAVSEYQYYEFLAIDRPLTEQQRAELRNISSRAQITATSFVNEYNWGDLRADPETLMERYFDAHLYLANWGTRILMFRLPRDVLDAETAALYCFSDAASVTEAGEHVIIRMYSDQNDDDEWLEGDGQLAAMVQARSDLAAGDLRLLYLGWLFAVQLGDIDGEDDEPPVPAGLGALNGSLRAVADFLGIDEDLLAIAAAGSADMRADSDAGLPEWVTALPLHQKDEFLTRVAKGEGALVQSLLQRRFRETRQDDHPGPTATPRTALDLWTAAKEHRERREAAKAEEERQRAQREAAAQAERYARHLDDLAGRQEMAWQQAASMIETKAPRAYDDAVALLADLRAVAERDGTTAAFTTRFLALREQHTRKPSLMDRFNKAGFPSDALQTG
jgi:hypothetical protein